MPTMNAGQLDHRNIGSHVSFTLSDDGTLSGAIAVVFQNALETTITLAHGGEEIVIHAHTPVEVSLPPAAAYTLALKNAVEDLLDRLEKNA
jgi:hypothetical protein